MKFQPPTPHLEKLVAALQNDKLPAADRPRIAAAILRYRKWIQDLQSLNQKTPEDLIIARVALLNDYKLYVDLELIFDSEQDFLYRQKGQLKLDNSIIEEFLPWLLDDKMCPELRNGFSVGPTNCFAAVAFESSLTDAKVGAGITVRTKNQDFALARKLFLRASHDREFKEAAEVETYIGYVATEVKTNLDKTMFQEACATARDLRVAVPAARYFLMCEWLDMTPVSTATTDIEEVLILRGAKRVGSDVRKHFSESAKRRAYRDVYRINLEQGSFRPDVFARWCGHIRALLENEDPLERDVLTKGYF